MTIDGFDALMFVNSNAMKSTQFLEVVNLKSRIIGSCICVESDGGKLM